MLKFLHHSMTKSHNSRSAPQPQPRATRRRNILEYNISALLCAVLYRQAIYQKNKQAKKKWQTIEEKMRNVIETKRNPYKNANPSASNVANDTYMF